VLREGFAQWRRMGVRRGTAAAARLATRGARARGRRTWLRYRPLSVSPSELYEALGGPSVELPTFPAVAAFERQLEDSRAELLAVAERVAGHTFDLLGSGPTDLGPKIDWALDFKSGRRWPLDHISRLPQVYPDRSDIKVPWELSRFQHLPGLAAAYRLTGEQRWLDEIGAQLDDWIAANPVEFGPNWSCTMDVAIRGANWVATLALLGEDAARAPWFKRTLSSLLLHGRFIRTHLEWAEVRGNHYLSDVVGLLYVAAPFAKGREGRAWAEWAAAEVVAELGHQVREDGCDHEASIPYHRLVTELFVCGLQAADALVPGSVPPAAHERLRKMLRFVADYTRPDGLAPQVGDADDGRFLPLGDYGRTEFRSHLHLFAQAGEEFEPATGDAAYPHGGYWIMRRGELYAIVRCGDVGVGGRGSHAHNDALSFELALGDQPLVVDPGSYLYTADPRERDRFRSTAFHSTLQLDGEEQNPIGEEALFAMEDRRHAEPLEWTPGAFVGRHHGFPGAIHHRRIELATELTVTDTVSSDDEHEAQWTFPLAPCEAKAHDDHVTATFPSGVTLELAGEGLAFAVEEGWLSPSYGRRIPTPFVRARKRTLPGDDVTVVTLRAARTQRA
jgi:hypothetical protein